MINIKLSQLIVFKHAVLLNNNGESKGALYSETSSHHDDSLRGKPVTHLPRGIS
jgi:hypothetical protein